METGVQILFVSLRLAFEPRVRIGPAIAVGNGVEACPTRLRSPAWRSAPLASVCTSTSEP
ncbi:hypothetical protein AURDEDRAFT_177627 [Auricularia subglabra TFB-10046 SS5]|uniref:Uncharacterized protein n=1 Tax=Auricularia subglabra (strain TFB-10046 / SS5) TaxID=717982 RepID=J0LA65_AURST|nr:hypothetical protein AURDEDRAFT_177627 [Auricularia subglabra TFB-10046 SS5]